MSYAADIEELLGPVGAAGPAGSPPESVSLPTPAGGDHVTYGAYDGASRFNRDLALWLPPLQSADGDIIPHKPILDSRVRDTLRNDAYVASGADIHRDNIVGAVFFLNSKPAFKTLGLDEVWAKEFQEETEEMFTLWAESPNNWVDAARRNNFTALVRLAIGIDTMAGELLASVEWLRDGGSSRPFNTAIQMIDVDRLSTPPELASDDTVRGGVKRNQWGAPIGYYFRQAHPSDFMNPDMWRWKYVPATKPWGRPQIIHLFEQQRPDQSRGVAAMVAALKELRITKKFRDIVLQNAVVNATYAASIESDLPPDAAYQALGGQDSVGKYIADYATQYLSAISQYVGSSRNLHIDGVKIPHLFPGTKLQLRPAGQGGPLGTDFEQSLIRYIAAILGVSYEELSRDYTRTNYSSARAAMTQTWKRMVARKRLVADRFATMIFRLWLEEAINKRLITSMPANAPSWYDGMNADAYSVCDWIGASRGQIDELKETQAAVLRLKYHLTTYEEEMARLGKDWRKSFAQSQREQDELKARDLQIATGSDNMMNATTGAPRQGEAQDEKADGSGDATDA